MSVSDDILLSIQEQNCVEAFPKSSSYGAPKLKQQEHQWFSWDDISNDQKIARVNQRFQQTRELDPSPISIHAVQTQCGTRDGFSSSSWGGEAQI